MLSLSQLCAWHLVSTTPSRPLCSCAEAGGGWGGEVWVSCSAPRLFSERLRCLAQRRPHRSPFGSSALWSGPHARSLKTDEALPPLFARLPYTLLRESGIHCLCVSSQPARSSSTSLTGSGCTCARWTVCRQMFWAARTQANTRASGTW